VCRYGCDILAGLAQLHSRGVIMLDLKPHNVLLTGGMDAGGGPASDPGRAVLTDFGMARTLQRGATRIKVRWCWGLEHWGAGAGRWGWGWPQSP
jgi:serine/threonine protein kinase